MAQRAALVERHTKLLHKMREAVALKDVQIDQLEEDMDKAAVADYADDWVCIKRPDGSIQSAFRSFHRCTSGAGEGGGYCGSVICSKHWLRRFESEAIAFAKVC